MLCQEKDLQLPPTFWLDICLLTRAPPLRQRFTQIGSDFLARLLSLWLNVNTISMLQEVNTALKVILDRSPNASTKKMAYCTVVGACNSYSFTQSKVGVPPNNITECVVILFLSLLQGHHQTWIHSRISSTNLKLALNIYAYIAYMLQRANNLPINLTGTQHLTFKMLCCPSEAFVCEYSVAIIE